MKKELILSLVFAVITNVGLAQTYNLSKETIQEYKELMGEYKNVTVGKAILGIAVFGNLYESDPISGTFNIVINNSDWSLYLSAIKGFQSFVHQRMANVCGANSISNRISKNSDDRKFWKKLYEYHHKMS